MTFDAMATGKRLRIFGEEVNGGTSRLFLGSWTATSVRRSTELRAKWVLEPIMSRPTHVSTLTNDNRKFACWLSCP